MLAEEAAYWGIPAEALHGLEADEDDPDAGLWPDNEPAVLAFLGIATQWRCVGTDGGLHWLGLDYQAVRAGWQLAADEITPDLWTQVQLIEAGALSALNGGRS